MNRKYKILIVEDEESLRFVYSEYLASEGFEVLQAEDGEKALELVNENKDLDMILLDLMIPKIDGIKVLEKLKSDSATKNIKVYLMTVLAKDTTIEKAFDIGSDGYLIKDTLTPEQIKTEILAVLEGK